MNDERKSDILRALAIEDAIRHQMDNIVRQAGETIRLLKPNGGRSEMKENQIRNVLNVAEESKSVEVVTNFIRYQIGRSSSNQQWQYNGFGLQVIKDIEEGEVPVAADRAAKAAAEVIGEGADKEALCREAYLELTRYYLGYLNRAFYFCDKMGEAKGKPIPDPWAVVVRVKEACQDV
jgi:hypothetical protein